MDTKYNQRKNGLKEEKRHKLQQRKNGLKQERIQNTRKEEWIKTGEEKKYNNERMD